MLDQLRKFILEQVRLKRASPTDGMLSGLIHTETEPPLTDEEVVGMANLLLVGEHETTSNMLALGLRPAGAPGAAGGPARPARADRRGGGGDAALPEHRAPRPAAHRTEEVEIAGEVILPESLVIVSLSVANRDPRHFDRPTDFDVTRPAPGGARRAGFTARQDGRLRGAQPARGGDAP